MSDGGTPGEGDVTPDPTPGPPAPTDATSAAATAAPPSRRRVVVLGVIGVIVVAVALALGLHGRGASGGGSRDAATAGGAAIHAPAGPTVPSIPGATGVHLTGFVVDGAGLPVAGAEVSVELERGLSDRAVAVTTTSTDAGVAIDAQNAIAAAVDAGAVASAAPPSALDGKFTIEGLAPGRYRVRVSGPGLLAAEVRFVPVPSDAARLVVARQVAITGTVRDGGAPVPNATVALRGEAIGGTIEVHADAAGAFAFQELPEGRYQLWAYQQALAARTVRVNRLGAGPFVPVELALESATIVAGRVIDRDEGTGLAAAIELRPVGDDQAPRYARTADDGTFRIEGVPHGTWIADAFSPGFTSPSGVELVAGKSIPELALVRGATVEGRVLDGDGRPVADAVVRAIGGTTANPIEQSEDLDRDKLRRFSGRTAATAPVGPSMLSAGDPELIPRGELGVM
ncbi:MAG: carboxypeptidase regulatory-like domain-containing protein, partial [Proteobacteria bacterium]|nr:carboxypeptidase regulatory-like domain-containing protein [Pseudomonadota bacterium]